MLKELIKLANKLDQRDLTKEADYLDGVIKKYSSDYWDGFEPGEKYDMLKGKQPKHDHLGRPIVSEETEEASEFDVESFVLNNFINIDPEYSEDFQDIEDLWQSSGEEYGHQLLVEHFDSILERLDMEGQQSEESFDKIIETLEELSYNKENIAYRDVVKDVASFFRQHLIRGGLIEGIEE
jgi:hypothetical protein